MRSHIERFGGVLLAVGATFASGQTVDSPLTIGNGVSAPKLIRQVDPEFPRSYPSKQKGGEVVIHLVVDTNGLPQHVIVQKTTDARLNEPALKAIREYRFDPALREEKPVAVEMNVVVNFQIFR